MWRGAVAAARGASMVGDIIVSPVARRRPLWIVAAAAAVAVLVAIGVPLLRRNRSTPNPVAGGGTPTPASGFVSSTLAPGRQIPSCPPTASATRVALTGADQLPSLLDAAIQSCSAPLTRADAGTHRTPYGGELATHVVGLDLCLTQLYDQTDAPLLPVFAEPATYNDKNALVVVFMTTYKTPAAATDALDKRQVWVMDETTCDPLNVATS
jgi:hypothetical protein